MMMICDDGDDDDDDGRWMVDNDEIIVAPSVALETMMTPSRNNDRSTSHVLRMT